MLDKGIQTFTVRLRHDGGAVAITTPASTPGAAIDAVLAAERAPRSAVLTVTEGARVFGTVLGTNRDARDAITRRRSWRNRASSFYATHTLTLPGHTGELPAEARAELQAAYDGRARHVLGVRSLYVVWSYATPIAWTDTDGALIVPDIRYSMTTTRHQTECRMADGARSVSLGMTDAPSWRGRSGRR